MDQKKGCKYHDSFQTEEDADLMNKQAMSVVALRTIVQYLQ